MTDRRTYSIAPFEPIGDAIARVVAQVRRRVEAQEKKNEAKDAGKS